MTNFLLGAGFNMDAADEARQLRGGTTYGLEDASYPLVPNLAQHCFGLAQLPLGNSVEDLFSEAIESKNYSPVRKLADILNKCDYYTATALTSNEDNAYRQFFQNFEGSHFLTFNYDSLPELILLKLRRWYPCDGYGMPVSFKLSDEEFKVGKSTSLVLHLHGSLCVSTSETEIKQEPGQIAWISMRESPKFSFRPRSVPFPGFASNSATIYDVEDRIIAPIRDKSSGRKRVFIDNVYETSSIVLRNSGTLIVIGYSFGHHDRESYRQLLDALGESSERRLLIVAPDAQDIAMRLRKNFPNICIDPMPLTFKEWAVNSYPVKTPYLKTAASAQTATAGLLGPCSKSIRTAGSPTSTPESPIADG